MPAPREGQIIHVNHPVPLRCVHRSPLKQRIDFVQAVTPVRLRHASLAEFRKVASMRDSHGVPEPVFEHEGSLWTECQDRGYGEADKFVRILEDTETHEEMYFAYRFLRTPLLAFWRDGRMRGDGEGVPRVRRVLHDGTERARADLKAFLDRNVRIVGNDVYLRCHGPLACHQSAHLGPKFVVRTTGLQHNTSTIWESEHVFAPRLDRVDAFWGFEKRFYTEIGSPKLRAKAAASPVEIHADGLFRLDPALFADDDVLDFANDAPGLVLRELVEQNKSQPDVPTAALQAIAERLYPWQAIGGVGGIRPDEAEEVTSLVAGMVRALEAHYGAERVAVNIRKFGRYAEEMILPAIRRAQEPEALPEEDAEAFGGMMRP